MSVCVAAACEMSSVIVTAMDRLLSYPSTSLDVALKAAYIAPRWIALLAGDDISIASEDVLHEMRDSLREHTSGLSVPHVKGVLESSWRVIQNRVAATTVLAPYDMTIAEFKRSRTRLGNALFTDLARKIEDASRLRLQLLVCGFDHLNKPGLLVHEDDYGCRDFSRAGCLAIGSGHTAALASLAFHNYESKCSLSQAIYQACAAKFMAEKAPGVGRETIVICLKDDGTTCWLFGTAIRIIRDMWERETRPKLPPPEKTAALIDPIVNEVGWQPL